MGYNFPNAKTIQELDEQGHKRYQALRSSDSQPQIILDKIGEINKFIGLYLWWAFCIFLIKITMKNQIINGKALNGLVAVILGIIFNNEIIVSLGLIAFGLWLAIKTLREKENVRKANRVISIVAIVLGIVGIISVVFINILGQLNK